MTATNSHLEMWIIYDHPRDYPEHFVARKWVIKEGGAVGTDDKRFAHSLKEIRETVPRGLMCLPRHPTDEPQVVEVWF